MPDDYTYHVLKKAKKIKIDVLTYLILSCMKIGQMHTNKKDEEFIWYEEL